MGWKFSLSRFYNEELRNNAAAPSSVSILVQIFDLIGTPFRLDNRTDEVSNIHASCQQTYLLKQLHNLFLLTSNVFEYGFLCEL
jgi:hypothetical protein